VNAPTARTARTWLRRGAAWKLGTLSAAGVLLAFMAMPVVALVTTLRWSDFRAGILHPSVGPALRLSLFTTGLSLAIIVLLGTPLAWYLSARRGQLARVVETLVRLPAVLPPAVAGVALLLAFGRMGLAGRWLAEWGWSIPFTTSAVVMAEVFVAAPFYLQAATTAFRGIDASQITVARTLGASPMRVFLRIALPLSRRALVAGAAMSWMRALGEFGATLMFAGNLSGETQTLTLAVYTTFESDLRAAQAISLVLVAVGFAALHAVASTVERGHEART